MKQFKQFIYWVIDGNNYISSHGCSWFFVRIPGDSEKWYFTKVQTWKCDVSSIKTDKRVLLYKEINSKGFKTITGTKFEDYFVEFLED